MLFPQHGQLVWMLYERLYPFLYKPNLTFSANGVIFKGHKSALLHLKTNVFLFHHFLPSPTCFCVMCVKRKLNKKVVNFFY